MRRYIHYGAPSYDPELFQAVNYPLRLRAITIHTPT